MRQKADLHIHTTASGDALNKPEGIFKKAQKAGLSAVSFTDHDSTLHHHLGWELSRKYKIEFLPGIELTSSWKRQNTGVLAYFSNSAGPSLETFLNVKARATARDTAVWLIKKMREMGIDVTLEEYDEAAKKCAACDSPLLRLMIQKGHVKDIFDYKRKFEKIGYPDFSSSIPEVIKEVHKAGGMAVLAHPGGKGSIYEFGEEDIKKVIEAGIDGLEVYHPWNDNAMQEICLRLTRQHNLIVTGGSDNHGSEAHSEDNNEIGSYWCDWELVKNKIDVM